MENKAFREFKDKYYSFVASWSTLESMDPSTTDFWVKMHQLSRRVDELVVDYMRLPLEVRTSEHNYFDIISKIKMKLNG